MDTPGAGLGYLRGYNDALVVGLARTAPAFDRASIAAATGLTPQAVSKVLARLTGDGLIEPAGVRRGGVGKPATMYRIVAGSRFAIGVHVARTGVRLVLTDLLGTVLSRSWAPLPVDFTPGELLAAIGTARTVLFRDGPVDPARVLGLGLGMVGPLDHANGIVRDAHRLRHWHDVPLRELAARELGLAVHLDKDVTAGVTAEAWRRGADFRDGVLIMVESGIGAGLWLGGAAYRGAHTNAGEFGHTVMQLDGPACVCGRRGCLEVLHDAAVARGDLPHAARLLAVGVVNLLQTTDVGHVVLAGADLLRHRDVYLAAIAAAVRLEVPRADWLTVDVSVSALGSDVIAAGAAMQVLNAVYGRPSPDSALLGGGRQ
ncbi:ROK family protein [Dactylosporangium vinaceum]|uniref:ROK family protein n=1 Tax=Dactylosporangium vinaceum TaxID=53362 RepID=A0ABV5M429_9ACTN|nr:ROK family transcriptional regulator [Dactylosporangium vinaceum]UAB93468.1 ROK family protein [Dactylosporangium vinaceum]